VTKKVKKGFVDLLVTGTNFWEQPVTSKTWDEAIANPVVQQDIANKKDQGLYALVEQKIASDHAMLVDNLLRASFLNIPISDFRVASGFGNPAKASAAVKNYNEVHAYLSFFVKQDIGQHINSPDARLNAFRRWVSVSSLLLENGSYEGFVLVFTNLQVLATPQLEHGLPLPLLREYNRMCQLNAPIKNQGALRQHIDEQAHEKSLSPLLLRFRDINTLNETLETLQDRKAHFTKRIELINKNISKRIEDGEQSEELQSYLDEKKAKLARFQRIIKRKEKTIDELLLARENILISIANEKRQPADALSNHLQGIYREIRKDYAHEAAKEKEKENDEVITPSSAPASPRGHQRERTSTLYSEKMLPGFFSRGRVSPDKHWEEVFQARPRAVSV
jgi:hypothetical protein